MAMALQSREERMEPHFSPHGMARPAAMNAIGMFGASKLVQFRPGTLLSRRFPLFQKLRHIVRTDSNAILEFAPLLAVEQFSIRFEHREAWNPFFQRNFVFLHEIEIAVVVAHI